MILRSPPMTEEQVRRLLELGGLEPAVPLPMLPDAIDQHAPVPKTPLMPRRRRSGVWY